MFATSFLSPKNIARINLQENYKEFRNHLKVFSEDLTNRLGT